MGLRILFEALGFGEADNLGGSVRVARASAHALALRGHSVTFVCTNRKDRRRRLTDGTVERVAQDGVRAIYIDTTTIPWWPGSFGPHWVHGGRALVERLATEHDVVHLHEYRSFLAAISAAAARRAGKPYIVQPQGTLRPGQRSQGMKRVYDRLIGGSLLENASRLVAATDRELELFARAGVPRDRCVVVPNGLDLAEYGPTPARAAFRRRLGIAADTPLVVFVGRLDSTKGADLLVEAFRRLGHPTAKLAVVGPDHGLGASLRQAIARDALEDRIILTGALKEDSAVREALADADVFALTSRSEAFGMVILEACAAGRPMLLSEGCEVADAFRDRAAVVVRGEVDAIAEGLQRMLADAELRERFGRSGRDILERDFTLEAVGRRLEQVYTDVVSAHAAIGA